MLALSPNEGGRHEFCGFNAIAYWKKWAGTQTDLLSGDVRIFAMLLVHVWEISIDHGESTLHISSQNWIKKVQLQWHTGHCTTNYNDTLGTVPQTIN